MVSLYGDAVTIQKRYTRNTKGNANNKQQAVQLSYGRFRTRDSEPHIHLNCLYIDYLEYGMSLIPNSMTLNLSRKM